ncbi:MAG TPA: TonB-dependent receptor, partial [Burkholderiaceae bacterium]
TGLYGILTTEHAQSFQGYSPDVRQVIANPNTRVPGLTYGAGSPVSGNTIGAGAKEEVKAFRLDVEYKLGKHTLRAGLDDIRASSVNAGDRSAGGGTWTYFRSAQTPTTPVAMTGAQVAPATGGGFGTQGYYVRERVFSSLTNVYSNQSAQYLEDRYQFSKNLLLTAGLRREEFENLNGDKVTFVEQKNQLAPRFAFAWDMQGDASMRLFGSAGRYFVQLPSRIGVRGASRSTLVDNYYTYTGVGANGAPTGLVRLAGPLSSNNEFGQAKDAKTVAAAGLKPNFQDELTLGFDNAYSADLNLGVRGTYRKLQSTIDDTCDYRPFDAWAVRNRVNTSNYGGFGCASFNPGEDNQFYVDYAGTGTNHTLITLTAADLRFEKPKRNYAALDMYLEHPYRNGWYARVNYTWSRLHGNTEGQTLSDLGQADVAATVTWDYPEVMENATGLLPNNRTHQIKAFGFYDITPQWTVGANVLLASGRPISCLGNYPTAIEIDYGSDHHYCDGRASPRGSMGKLPADIRLDMNLVYRPAMLKGLSLKFDMFNVTNRQAVQAIDEQKYSGTQISPTYRRAISYTAPRSARLTAEYTHKF